MDTNKVSGDIESSPFAPWLLVSCGSKYGRKGNGGIGNIGKASNEGRMSGGGFQAVKIGVENISIDGVLGNGEVGNSENYGSKNGKTSKHAFDKVGDPRFEVLNEEMDKVVNDVLREQNKVGCSHKSNDKVNKIDITYDATFEVAASNLKKVMSRVVE
ncbi:hypothetical protein QYF36_019257 [Acer negundo]|nr:hypothetical protein QYF36_019257 [Acer negundo]